MPFGLVSKLSSLNRYLPAGKNVLENHKFLITGAQLHIMSIFYIGLKKSFKNFRKNIQILWMVDFGFIFQTLPA